MDYKNYILHFTSFYGSWGAHLLILDARGGGGHSHMKQTGMLVGNFEFNP